MAKKESKSASISVYTPNSITLKVGGEDVVVALDRQENSFLNMVLASQGRALVQRTLAHWKDQDAIPSPKELRDIAGAMKDIAAFSAEVYAAAEPVASKDPEKQAEKAAEEINFDELTRPIEPHGTGKEDKTARYDEAPEAPSDGLAGKSPEGHP